ncbi:phytoene desaturase family protein [Puniceicoccus vermicola]|uniref:NAD(P)/FAD-dependent oxidoreductase n=1 Tax=Puniceicoccus vermicola TaxID=388746 RepID=A0A7X1AX81_9BACT|nr:NAD(P)/FAD-dependent oxidoreductase [Puniceicoccus vermicola]MBC2601675.1 NAD(P)/FAD-dependent oxidoreductase [Puniceicoccus vermicola]
MSDYYDVVVIGAGMSGLAAAIRVALAGKSVVVLEKHEAPGGLNSFYRQDGRVFDVGLHALTNYAEKGQKRAPLNKIFRQLRIPREAFDLNPQVGSRIRFPEASLAFTNDPARLEEEIATHFPDCIDGYREVVRFVEERDATALTDRGEMAGPFLREKIADPLLREMLLCPILYYGSATEDDLDLDQFVILFRSLFLEGFSRPVEGVRTIVRALLKKLKEVGGERRMRCGVARILTESGKATGLELDDGTTLRTGTILSSAGLVETNELCGVREDRERVGRLSFVETISVYHENPGNFGWEDTITFFSTRRPFRYQRPQDDLVDPCSGVICIPNHYQYEEGRSLKEGLVRLTALANYDRWKSLPAEEYQVAKTDWFRRLQEVAREVLPVPTKDPTHSLVGRDMFTPLTVEKFTGHLGGAVYGSSQKAKDGRTDFENLYLCGTDQGFLGIVGAMLSGISIANRYVVAGE